MQWKVQAARRSLRSLPFSEPAGWRMKTSSLASLAPLASFLGASCVAGGASSRASQALVLAIALKADARRVADRYRSQA